MSTSQLFEQFEANPDDHRAFSALIKQLVGAGDHVDLQEVYDRMPVWATDGASSPLMRVLLQEARTATDEDTGDFLHLSNGLLLWRHFDDPQKAEMSFRKIQNKGTEPETLRAFYMDYYTAQKNWRRLEQFLTDPSQGAMADPLEVKRLLGNLTEEHEQPERAITFWQGILREIPEDAEADEALGRLYPVVGKWHAMVELLKGRLKHLPAEDHGSRLSLHKEMIEIYDQHLHAPSKVVGVWQAILEMDPGNQEALGALLSQYEAMNRWPDLVKILQQMVRHEDDATVCIDLHRRIADIMMERFSNAAEAIRHYEAIRELDPEDQNAITVLKEIYEQRRDWERFVQVSEQEISLLDDPDEVQSRLRALAKTASQRIRKPATPMLLWERVLDTHPADPEALEELELLCERDRDFPRLAEILMQRIEVLDAPDAKMAALEKLATIYVSRLELAHEASEIWARVLEIDPSHRKAQAELKRAMLAQKDWDGLESFFRSYGNAAEWVRTLESQARAAESPEERLSLLRRAALLWKDELGDERRAVKNLELVREEAPEDPETAQALIPLYRNLKAWKKLPEVYGITLAHTEDAGERRSILMELAEVQDQHLGDAAAALETHIIALREDPGTVGVSPSLRDLAERSGQWRAYVEVLTEVMEDLPDENTRQEALLEVGRAARTALDDPDTALSSYLRVLEIDRGHEEALNALEEIHRDREDWASLVEVLERRLRVTREEGARLDLLRQLAEAWEGPLDDPRQATRIYRNIVEEDSGQLHAHDALIRLLTQQGEHDELRDALKAKLEVLRALDAPTDILAIVSTQLGMLCYATLGDSEAIDLAVGHYGEALNLDPNQEEARCQLESLLADPEHRARIAEILEPIYRAQGQWDQVAATSEIRFESLRSSGSGEVGRCLTTLISLYGERLESPEREWHARGRLVEVTPEDEANREVFEALSDALDRWAQLIQVYQHAAEESHAPGTRVALLRAVARAYHHRLDDLEQARAIYHLVLDETGEDEEALDALEAIYEERHEPGELLEICQRQLVLLQSDDGRLERTLQISDLLAHELQRFDEAIEAARDALAIVPDHDPTIQRLDELYTRTERWTELVALLEDQSNSCVDDPERHATMLLRLGSVHEERIEDVPGAIELYGRILETPASEAAMGALERLFRQPEWAEQISVLLEPCYTNRGDWQALIRIYEVREHSTDDVESKVRCHCRISRLYEEDGGDLDMAFEHMGLAVTLLPDRGESVDELLRLADLTNHHEEALSLLTGVVEEILDPHRRAEVQRTLARLARDKVGDPELAERHMLDLLELLPQDREATDGLIALAREGDEHRKLIQLLRGKASFGADQQDRRVVLKEAAELASTVLRDNALAIEIYEEMRANDPEDMESLDALARLYQDTEAWEPFIEVLRDKLQQTNDLDTRKGIAAEMGHTQAKRLDALDDAIQTWRTVLEWDPDEVGALRELDRLYAEQEDWYSLRDVMVRLQQLVDEMGWLELQFRLARLYENEEQLGDVQAAIDSYRELLNRRPDHPGAIDGLRGIVEHRDEREHAFPVVEPALRSAERYEDLWELYEVMALHRRDEPEGRVELLERMAELAEQPLEDPERAFAAAARALHVLPSLKRTRRALTRMARDNDLWDGLANLYEETAGEVDDPEVGRDLTLLAAATVADQLADNTRAIDLYLQVQEEWPDDGEMLERLQALYVAENKHGQLAEVLRHRADLAGDTATRTGFLGEMARVQEGKLNDEEAAYETYSEILDLDGDSDLAIAELWRIFVDGRHRLSIADRLEPIYLRREAWDDLHGLLELKLDELGAPEQRSEVMVRLGELNLDRLARKPEALIWYGRALRLDPDDDQLLDQACNIARDVSLWDDLRTVLVDAAQFAEDEQRRVALWQRAADVARRHLGDDIEAERICLLIRDADPEDMAALGMLDELLASQQRWSELEPILLQRIDTSEDEANRFDLLQRLVSLYQRQLERPGDAISTCQRILDTEPGHRPTLLTLEALYEERSAWENLVDVKRQLADSALNDDDRGNHLVSLAKLTEEHLGQIPDAVDIWEEVLGTDPGNGEALHNLQRLLESTEDWDELLVAFEREARLPDLAQDRRLELARSMGRVATDKLEDIYAAQGHWEAARALVATDKETLTALRSIYRETSQTDALAQVLKDQIDSGNYLESEQTDTWRELAQICTESLGRPDEAIESWRQVLSMSPGDEAAFDQLRELYETQGRWTEAVELHQERLEGLEGEERLEAWMHIGGIQEHQLEDEEGALTTYRVVLDEFPEELEASQRLESLYERREDWESLCIVLLDRADILSDSVDRVLTLQRLAEVYETCLSQPENAFAVLQRACAETPGDVDILSAAHRLGVATESWEALVATYDSALAHLEGDAALDVMLRTAVLVRDQLGRPEDAVLYFERILEQNPDHEDALRALIDLHTTLEQWEPLIVVLDRATEIVADPQDQASFLRHLAVTCDERLDDSAGAVAAWYRVLDLDDVDQPALLALDKLHTRREEWRQLVEVLERMSQAESSQMVPLTLRIADILETRLGRPVDAIEQYEEVLGYDPGNEAAIERLIALHGDTGDWAKLVDIYERAFDAATTDEHRIDIARKIVLLLQEVFRDDDTAVDWCHRILAMVPDDSDTLGRLENIYTGAEAWDDLIQVLELSCDRLQEKDERVRALMRMGEIHQEKLDDPDSAIAAYERVLIEEPEHPETLARLEVLYTASGLWEQVLETLERQLALATEPDQRVGILCRQARIALDEIGHPLDAAAHYEQALEARPDSVDIVEALVSIYGGEERHEEVVRVMETILETDPPAEQKGSYHVRLAAVWSEKFADEDKARHHLEAAVEVDPEDKRALWPLAQHYVEREAWTAAMPLLDVLADQLTEDDDTDLRATTHAHLARCAQELLDEDRAFEEYVLARDLAPDDPEVLMGLGLLAAKQQRDDLARESLQAAVTMGPEVLDETQMRVALLRLGECAFRSGHLEEAKAHLEAVIAAEPENQEALQTVEAVLAAHGDWDDVVTLRERRLAALKDPLDRFQLLMDLGDTYRDHLEDTAQASRCYEAALGEGVASKAPILQMVDLHAKAQDFPEAIRWLQKLIEQEDETSRRALYAMSIAVMYRDELGDVEQAVNYLNQVLDYDLQKLDAFRSIDELLTRAREWDLLKANYDQMITRVNKPDTTVEDLDSLLFMLHRGRGEILRSRLKQAEDAISSFEKARALRPDDLEVAEILADLYDSQDPPEEQALQQHLELVRLAPKRLQSYHRIFEEAQSRADADMAWRVSALLTAMGQANEEEEIHFQSWREPGILEQDGPLGDGILGKDLSDESEDELLGDIFAILYQVLGAHLNLNDVKEFGLKSNALIDPSAQTLAASTLRRAASMLGVELPRLYGGPCPTGMGLIPSWPPCMIVDPTMLTGQTEQQLAFRGVRSLAGISPRRALANLCSREHLDLIFMAAASLVDPSFQLHLREDLDPETHQSLARQVGELRAKLKQHITPEVEEKLSDKMKAYWDLEHQPTISGWLGGVELSAQNTAVLVANDVVAAWEAIAADAPGASRLKRRDRLKALVRFTLGAQYASLREHFGLEVPPPDNRES